MFNFTNRTSSGANVTIQTADLSILLWRLQFSGISIEADTYKFNTQIQIDNSCCIRLVCVCVRQLIFDNKLFAVSVIAYA